MKEDAPREDLEAFYGARDSIWSAANLILGDFMRSSMSSTDEALQHAPIPILAGPASVLLRLWSALDTLKVGLL